MSEIATLFGSQDKVTLMQHFLAHPSSSFTAKSLRERLFIDGRALRTLLNNLVAANFLLEAAPLQPEKKSKGKPEARWRLNQRVSYLTSLQKLLSPSVILSADSLLARLKERGKVLRVVLSGIFENVSEEERIIDILIVGDRFDRDEVDELIEELEEEVGKEIMYAFFTREEYQYRLDMHDKLLKELTFVPHRILTSKI